MVLVYRRSFLHLKEDRTEHRRTRSESGRSSCEEESVCIDHLRDLWESSSRASTHCSAAVSCDDGGDDRSEETSGCGSSFPAWDQGAVSTTRATSSVIVTETEHRPLECAESESLTTLMLRNIPNRVKLPEVHAFLALFGFETGYNAVLLPCDTRTNRNRGYAFINFKTHAEFKRGMAQLGGSRFPGKTSTKVTEVSVAAEQWVDGQAPRRKRVQ
mmetsp:Transcript_54052/g.143898  ORF Transcript_54052/g.143898 Transcript_54052/m.143898 type:complete len:215 (+) Transcript_54052:3137-3781(+)